jgi:AraC-like DNA-binding protein
MSGTAAPASYTERLPIAQLRGVARTVWIQQVGDEPYVQRHLPTGGVELHFPVGGRPHLLGPLTGPFVEVIPARTTVLGVRFFPGGAPPLPALLDDLVDQRVVLQDLWGADAERLAEELALAASAENGLALLQRHLLTEYRRAAHLDALVREAARILMPWRPSQVGDAADALALSPSQLRRRCLSATGLSPKVLQRALRFQGFLALAQAGAVASGRRDADGVAGLAADVGYSDQAHLNRECLRLTGATPLQLLGGVDRCACGHDHLASYAPFLAGRPMPLPAG